MGKKVAYTYKQLFSAPTELVLWMGAHFDFISLYNPHPQLLEMQEDTRKMCLESPSSKFIFQLPF